MSLWPKYPEWRIAPFLPEPDLDACDGVPRLLIQVLAAPTRLDWRQSGFRDRVLRFLAADLTALPDPHILLGMERALARIASAREKHQRITVYGDFDADGLTAAALLTLALRQFYGFESDLIDTYISERQESGRGPTLTAFQQLHAAGTNLIITVDCGSSSTEEIAYANQVGMDVIIVDHHQPPKTLPPALAMINPMQPDCPYPYKGFAAVGLAFKVAWALLGDTPFVRDLLDLVAIGTIADVAPLTDENHTLVRAGLERLRTTQRPGLRALAECSDLRLAEVNERDISFALAPRLNAAGRMEHARLAFRLLTCADAVEAQQLAATLQQLNKQRQERMAEILVEATSQLANAPLAPILMVGGDAWPTGIIGLVAGKLAERYQRPVVAFSRGATETRGSARSTPSFDIIATLARRPELFTHFGGHKQAAGFSLPNDRIEDLRRYLLTAMTEAAGSTGLLPEAATAPLAIDSRLRLRSVTLKTYEQLQWLAPFGVGNPEPLFAFEGTRVLRRWRGGENGIHLRLTASDGMERREFIWHRMGEIEEHLSPIVDIAATLDAYRRRDDESLVLHLRVRDVRPAAVSFEG
jgi:single-stranded-DNA-specific exonuclease